MIEAFNNFFTWYGALIVIAFAIYVVSWVASVGWKHGQK